MGKNPEPSQNRFDAFYRRGTQLLHEGQPTKALPLLEKANEIEPTDTDAALNLSGAYILTKKFRKAVPILETLSKSDPENEIIWINLGAAYLGNPVLATEEDQQRAIIAFRKAYTLNSNAPHVAYNLGLIYRDRRENEKAIFWFERALEANPKDKDARNLIRKLRKQE